MTASLPPVARVGGVTHLYGKTRALDNVTVDIPAGCMAGIIGPDGVGKSTLLGLIAGARMMQTGSVETLGDDMASARHREAVCPRIAYMPQGLGRNLYADLSVAENLDFFGRLFSQPAAERRARAKTLLKATGLDPFVARPAGKLSGGMKQKLGLCCALIHDPDLLILDEPTTGVDPLSRRHFWNLIQTIRETRPGMSVLISTAYMEEAERFQWLMAMDAGKLLATGSPAELLAQTAAATLEEAFVALVPEEKRGHHRRLSIPPLPADDEPPVIVAKNLTRHFGDFTAVNDVSFAIQRGEIFGFLGSNGCGKTTTMKMLTGLLPASAGEATLFGKKVDAADIETRRRVGYMSQSFSLYGELTVAQNLILHARLFAVPAEQRAARVEELTARFGLAPYRHELAERLPLGVRQRLSLAVALIHRPEMLILDEPTSGVDPMARDAFWESLITLSREEKVTIFIATHFMNEAMRCDRISLMHAGWVLACDAPEKLIADRGAATLDEAFIACMEEAEPAQGAVTSLAATAPRRAERKTVFPFSLGRLLAFCYRESLEIMRDPVRLVFAFVGSALLMVIFGFGITTDVNEIRYAALDLDQTPASRAYLRSLAGSGYFAEQPPILDAAALQERLKTHNISLAIEIPPGFGKESERGTPTEISAWIDGTHPMRGETIGGYVQGVHGTYMQERARQQSGHPAGLRVRIEPRFRYNPTFESIYAMVPAVPAILLILIPAILMAVSVVREKELGSITNFYVTPSKRPEFILGKQAPYVAIGMLNFFLLTAVAVLVFQVPLKGSALTLTFAALLYVTATTGIGFLISTFTSSQMAAVFGTAIFTMMPTIQFSGMLQPVSTLEGGARIMGSLWPTTYYMRISVGAFTKALQARDLLGDLVALALFIPVLTLLSALFLRKQER